MSSARLSDYGRERDGIRYLTNRYLEAWPDLCLVLAFVVLIFAGMAKLLIVLLRRFFRTIGSFEGRQGLANLYRPEQSHAALTISLGSETFLLLNYIFRAKSCSSIPLIGTKISRTFSSSISPDQPHAVAEVVRSFGLPSFRSTIVTMRLAEIKGRSTADILADPRRKFRSGTATRISLHLSRDAGRHRVR